MIILVLGFRVSRVISPTGLVLAGDSLGDGMATGDARERRDAGQR